jgi:hypothetical protein
MLVTLIVRMRRVIGGLAIRGSYLIKIFYAWGVFEEPSLEPRSAHSRLLSSILQHFSSYRVSYKIAVLVIISNVRSPRIMHPL